jgi:hypothetical protein
VVCLFLFFFFRFLFNLMAYRMNTRNYYYEDGYSSNEYHGAYHRGSLQNREKEISVGEDPPIVEEQSLMDLMKRFIHTQEIANEALENQFQEMERKLDQMEEMFSNEPTGQPIQNIQQHPSPNGKSSWYCEDDDSEDEDWLAVLDKLIGKDNLEECVEQPELEKVAKCELYMEDDSEDEDWCDEIDDLVKDYWEECVGKIETEELDYGLDGFETVSPMNVDVDFDLEKENEVEDEPEVESEVEEPKRAEKIIEHQEIEAYKFAFEEDDSEESVGKLEGEGAELLDIVVNNINSENEEEKEDVDGMTVEKFGKWLDEDLDGLETVSPIEFNEDFDFDEDIEFFEALEEENMAKNGLKCLETVFPNEVIKDAMVNEVIEVKDKPPDRDELYSQGIIFIDKLISYLTCRKEDESLEKVPMVSCHEKKCKNVCIYFDYFKKFGIFTNTRRWFDAWVKQFYGMFVLNEATIFYDYLRLWNGRDGLK